MKKVIIGAIILGVITLGSIGMFTDFGNSLFSQVNADEVTCEYKEFPPFSSESFDSMSAVQDRFAEENATNILEDGEFKLEDGKLLTEYCIGTKEEVE